MGQVPMNQIYDEHSEELSFPSIYLGEPRIFTIDNVTPFMMASSEIRRQDRRAVKSEHILYMAMKIMRIRLNQALQVTFKNTSDISNITRSDIENLEFVKKSMEHNMSFLKSIPNSAHYWFQRKRDVFSMIRQLGKPTLFLTLSASEYRWDNLLRTLYKLAEVTEFCGTNAVVQLSADKRTTLVNEDPVTCCLYFNKLVDTIMWILSSSKCSPFGNYKIIDWFKRIEFQQRGSPHAHLLLWLENDPNEEIGENMPQTLKMIDFLCSVDPQKLQNVTLQTHKHTFTCYKRGNDAENGRCRFEAPFWPIEKTSILIPMPKEDGRRSTLKSKYADMHRSLEFQEFPSLQAFLAHHNINSYENYLNVLRAGITRPRIFIKRKIEERFINSFHPWISQVLNSNMDIQFILEPYSCATYVLEYVNKTDRGITNLHRDLIKLRNEFPDKDYADLLKSLGIKVLNAVEMSCQEAAWYLLNLHMSEGSRKIEFIQTTWPQHRKRIQKSHKQLEEEDIGENSTNIWKENIFKKYEQRPSEIENVSLAQFVALYYKGVRGEYKRREKSKIIRYCNYDITDITEYKREMVLLHIPFRNEEIDLLDQNKFLQIYDNYENQILETRKQFESNIDIAKIIDICKNLCIDENIQNTPSETNNDQFITSRAVNDDIIHNINTGNNDDIIMGGLEKMTTAVKKRENVMTAQEYCQAMRQTNQEQRDLILEFVHRLLNNELSNPIQIFFTGPAGCGKTFTMSLLMETVNRFSQQHNVALNAYVATASTGMAAAALNGSTVHSAFRISNSNPRQQLGLAFETLNSFRSAFKNIRVVFIDECSMIGSGLLNQINSRLQQILHDFEHPFGNINIVICGDLRQLPPVCQTQIYKRSRTNLTGNTLWQSLQYYPLLQVMRQSNINFSKLLTKIGDGESLTSEEKSLIESRFVSTAYVNEHFPEAIRLFFRTSDVIAYNNESITGDAVIDYVAEDIYTGSNNPEQLASARNKIHKMKPDETGGLPFLIKLLIGKPYMIRTNINVVDGLVNGAIGILRYIERETNGVIKRLWLSFLHENIGKIVRAKFNPLIRAYPSIQKDWTPISQNTTSINLKSNIVSCKRKQFPIVEASAITIHKSQGGTYNTIIYEYDKKHEQQLVYVALSRCTTLEGIFITNRDNDHTFHHAKGKVNSELSTEYLRLRQHTLPTVSQICRNFLELANTSTTTVSICLLNVQSLQAHLTDICTDSILSKAQILLLTETWLENEKHLNLTGFKLLSKFKRNSIRSGGVAIYQNSTAIYFQSTNYNLSQFNTQRISSSHESIGDICSIEVKMNEYRLLIVSIYISPGTSQKNIRHFLDLHLISYSQKAADLFEVIREREYYQLPIILGADFNINFKDQTNQSFLTYMKENFNLEMNNDIISTTRNNTCIDAIFTRHLTDVQTINYVTYFSHHRPLLTKVSFNS